MRLSVLAVLALTGCATATIPNQPVQVVIVSQSPMRPSDVTLFQRITNEYVGKVRTAQPMTLAISVVPAHDILLNSYADIEQPGGYVSNSHSVPLVGGTTAAEVGFLPTVSATGGVIGTGYARPIEPTFVANAYSISYVITTASGRVVESRVLPISGALEDLHATGAYLAKRVAKAN